MGRVGDSAAALARLDSALGQLWRVDDGAVALARLQTTRQSSFLSQQGRRDLAVMKAEFDLAQTELQKAKQDMAKTVVSAPRSGVVVFSSKVDWQGRPVATGEKIVEIANPDNVEYRVDLSVSDSIVLTDGARVKVFLDSDPLEPKEARLISSAYRARVTDADQLAFQLTVQPLGGEQPRIGSRGTAQIFGETVTLGFYLFRRPLSKIRQMVGW